MKKLDNSRKSQIRSLTKAEAAETYGGAKDPSWRPGSGEHMIGKNGAKIEGGSKTLWQSGKTERVDVENPAPGQRPGQVHYHESNNRKWMYDILRRCFVDQDTKEIAPPRIQKLLENPNIQKAIEKALKYLGE